MRQPMESERRTAERLGLPVELVVQVMETYEEEAVAVIQEKIAQPMLSRHPHLCGFTQRTR